jgi:predicted nucleic acid-binding protein
MVLADSSVWIDYFNGAPTPEADLLDDLLGRELVATGDIILTEVLQGFASDAHFRRAKSLMEQLEYQDMLGKTVALSAAENYRRLRRRGVTVRKTIDVIIGTFCILQGVPLLHADRDFDPMEQHLGLRVLRP